MLQDFSELLLGYYVLEGELASLSSQAVHGLGIPAVTQHVAEVWVLLHTRWRCGHSFPSQRLGMAQRSAPRADTVSADLQYQACASAPLACSFVQPAAPGRCWGLHTAPAGMPYVQSQPGLERCDSVAFAGDLSLAPCQTAHCHLSLSHREISYLWPPKHPCPRAQMHTEKQAGIYMELKKSVTATIITLKRKDSKKRGRGDRLGGGGVRL